MKVALVHDWLTGMRGGERVLEVFCGIFPDAPIYTLLHIPGTVSRAIESHPIHVSFLKRLPAVERRYRHYLPLFPRAIESFDLSPYDLVLSSSHAVAKSAKKREGALHLCYCFTPMRYVWDRHDDYFAPGRMGLPSRLAARVAIPWLRRWDARTAARVDSFVAISRTISDRIQRAYGRESVVIEPPVDTDFFTAGSSTPAEDAPLLAVSALVPYKRVDLIVDAMRGRRERLRIVGQGPDLAKLRAQAPANVTFLGELSDEELREEYRGCKALVHAAVEDFGIAPIEAMACGRPVLGLGQGALSETVIPGQNGLLFPEQTVSSLRVFLDKLDRIPFNCALIRGSVLPYARDRFEKRFAQHLQQIQHERETRND